ARPIFRVSLSTKPVRWRKWPFRKGETLPKRPFAQPHGKNSRKRKCPRGDLNPHALYRALAPQASASAVSATRTRFGHRVRPERSTAQRATLMNRSQL